ncbi:TRAP transporter small permease subunit [Candidatus Rariloculus sp.]|uniref:TRAP transporter small permease subunit n=1 Tax=Candidatus Rariloculus sp. TaxID=3101265 RepID=UPI003D09C699
MERLADSVHRLSGFFGVVAAICLAAACLAVCQMVFVRYVLNASTVWQTEFVLYAVVAATLIGSPYVLATRGHVNVDLLSHYLGRRARRIAELFAATLGIVFCAVVAWSGWRYFYEAWTEGWVTESVWAPPLWIILLPLPLGLGLLVVQYVVDILCLLTGHEVGEPPDAAPGPPG